MNILEQTKNGVPVLYADGIEAAGGAVHGFSTRKGGVSQGIFASVPLRLAPCGGSLRRNPGGTRPDLRQNDSIPALSYHVFAVCQPKSREKFPRNQLP